MPKPEPHFEKRLDQLRAEALEKGVVSGRGVDVAGGPITRHPQRLDSADRPLPGYHGEPVVRPPVWTWEIPVYFFVGGCAGMAANIAFAAWLFDKMDIARAALWIAGAGAVLSPALLIMDLGRPRLFLNMLRVFKIRSPMSVGAWILSMYGTCAVPALGAYEIARLHWLGAPFDHLLHLAGFVLALGAAFWGLFLATYTGVLIAATVVPAWFSHRVVLPIHFGTAGLGSAAGLLEILGYHDPALWRIGLLAGIVETVLWLCVEFNRHGAADRAAHEGLSGWMIRVSELLTGPTSLALRLCGLAPVSGVAFALGSLLSRFGWMRAGHVSGVDPEAAFAAEAERR